MRADPSERGSECRQGLRSLGQRLRQERGPAERAASPALAPDLRRWQRAALSLVGSLFSAAGESQPWSLAFSATSDQQLCTVSLPKLSSATPRSRSQAPGLSHCTRGPTEAGGSSPEVASLILNRAFWAAQTLMGEGTREALRAAALGTEEG